MGVLEKIKAFFRRGKAATKVEPKLAAEKKTTEASGQEGTKG